MLNILAVQRKKAILPWDDWYFSLVIAVCYSRNSWTFHLYVFYSHAEMERMRDDTTVPVNIMNCIVILTFLTLQCSCKGNTNLYFQWQYFQGRLKCLLYWTENFKLRALVKIWKKTTLSVVPHNSFIVTYIHMCVWSGYVNFEGMVALRTLSFQPDINRNTFRVSLPSDSRTYHFHRASFINMICAGTEER